MINNYYVKCIVGIKNTYVLDLLFTYITKEQIIDEIIFYIYNKNTFTQVNSLINNNKNLKNKITISLGGSDNHNDILYKNNNSEYLYIYMADDLCYLSPQFIENILKWHIEKENFMSFPSIINTGINTFILQSMGIMPIFKEDEWQPDDYHKLDLTNLSAPQIVNIHNNFIEILLKDSLNILNYYQYYLYHEREIYKQCYVWSGKDILSNIDIVQYYLENKNKFCINGNIWASHFSFKEHFSDIIKFTNIIKNYRDIIKNV